MKCDSKKKFATRTGAEMALKKIWKTSWLSQQKKPCSSYKCPFCQKWHLTSKPRREGQLAIDKKVIK